MKLVEFPEQTTVIAKDQPPYAQFPCHQVGDARDTIIACWELSIFERLKILFTGKVWHLILKFDQKLQPQLLLVDKPKMEKNH
jgi:hypothetical protein